MAKEVKRTTARKTNAGTSATKKTATAIKTVMRLPTEDEIRARAYEIYLARNGAPGDPTADWQQAERELIESFSR